MPTIAFDTRGARNDPDLARIRQARRVEEHQAALRIETEKHRSALNRLALFLLVEAGSEEELEELRQAIMDGTLSPQHGTIILDQIDSMFDNQDPTARFNSGAGLAVGDDFRDQSGNLFPRILEEKRRLMHINAQQALWLPEDGADRPIGLGPEEEKRIVYNKRKVLADMLVSPDGAGADKVDKEVTFTGDSLIVFLDKDLGITKDTTPVFLVQKQQSGLGITRIVEN